MNGNFDANVTEISNITKIVKHFTINIRKSYTVTQLIVTSNREHKIGEIEQIAKFCL